MNEIQFVL